MTHGDFMRMLERNWDSWSHLPSGLNHLTNKLIIWNKDIFGNIFQKKKRLQRGLEEVQRDLSNIVSCRLLRLEVKLKKDWSDILLHEEIF